MDSKKTLVIDKSILQRLFEEERCDLLEGILREHQLIVPLILVEEVLVNVATSSYPKPLVAWKMLHFLDVNQCCWLDDIFAIAYRELVEGGHSEHRPKPGGEFMRGWEESKGDKAKCQLYARQRGFRLKESIQRWKQNQSKIAGSLQTVSKRPLPEKEFGEMLLEVLDGSVRDLVRRRGLFDAVFEDQFRLHGYAVERIRQAVDGIDAQTLQTIAPVTRKCLFVQLAYFLAPAIPIGTEKLIGMGDQANSIGDMQYVAAASLCDRLLTGDQDMSRMMRMVKGTGLWQGDVSFVHPKEPIGAVVPP